MLKDELYSNNASSGDNMKRFIQVVVSSVSLAQLRHAMNNVFIKM